MDTDTRTPAQKAMDKELGRAVVLASHDRYAARTYSMLALNHFLRGERQETYEALERCRVAGFFYRPGETYQWGSMVYMPTVLSAIGDCGVDVEHEVAEAGRESGTQIRTYPDGSIQIDGPGWPFADAATVDRQRAPVTIVFKRRLSQEVRTKFLNMLVEWANTVRSEGLFGEGPIEFAEPTVTFLTRAAQFSMDISASGPHTLVWFLLSLLAFCPVAIIIEVRFARLSEEWLKHLGTSGQLDVPLPLHNA